MPSLNLCGNASTLAPEAARREGLQEQTQEASERRDCQVLVR